MYASKWTYFIINRLFRYQMSRFVCCRVNASKFKWRQISCAAMQIGKHCRHHSVLFSIAIPQLGKRELVYVFFVHLFVVVFCCFVFVLHASISSLFFSSFCQGLAAVCDCDTPWAFIFACWSYHKLFSEIQGKLLTLVDFIMKIVHMTCYKFV